MKKFFKVLICSVIMTLLATVSAYAETYKYDKLNRLLVMTYSNGDVVQYSYDKGGNLLSTIRIDNINIVGIILNSSDIGLKVGDTFDLKVAVLLSDEKKYEITDYASFKSSNTEVVSINEAGQLNANSKGEAEITVAYSGKQELVKVIVGEKNDSGIKPTTPNGEYIDVEEYVELSNSPVAKIEQLEKASNNNSSEDIVKTELKDSLVNSTISNIGNINITESRNIPTVLILGSIGIIAAITAMIFIKKKR